MNMDQAFFSQVEDIVRRAGALFADRDLAGGVRAKGRTDFVTEVDTRVQSQVRRELQQLDPTIQFLGEEQADAAPDWSGRVWILDPVDGTTNLMHGFGHCAVSLGLAEGGKMLYGAVYDPAANELFTARAGAGAWCNGRPIHVSGAAHLSESLCFAGTNPGLRNRGDEAFRRMRALYDRSHDVRRLGAASVELCYVACGRADAYLEHGLKPWDLAAGWLIMEQAGGTVTDFAGGVPCLAAGSVDIAAAGGPVHSELLALV